MHPPGTMEVTFIFCGNFEILLYVIRKCLKVIKVDLKIEKTYIFFSSQFSYREKKD